jgi:adenosylcobinamide kinase/adenosylcobinamide-phosphate guanylyltransferase
MSRHILILGGARSGKSRHAESLADNHVGERLYVATAEPGDEEMRRRIAEHRQRRGREWRTIEEPAALAGVLEQACSENSFVLVDCLTLWLSNLMMRNINAAREAEQLCRIVPRLAGTLVFVSNEVGLGIVPENELGRRFRDDAGLLNQRVAAVCEEVVVMFAGIALRLKG